ncbi:MAG: proline dehydrogenase family protein [Vulcanimicrobiaceae bacterium]
MAVLGAMLSTPALQSRFFFLAKRFVAGETAASALAVVRTLNASGLTATLDYLGEDVTDPSEAVRTRDRYLALYDEIGRSGVRTNVSVKLSALGLLIDEDLCTSHLTALVARASTLADPFVRVDMEGSARVPATYRVLARVRGGSSHVGPVVQAYLLRAPDDVARAVAEGTRVRLCKGAYAESPEVALQDAREIRAAYLALAKTLLLRGVYPAFATHDSGLIDAIKTFAASHAIGRERFEFQLLYGVRPALATALAREGYNVRIYVPFGTHWARYFYRRVSERKENAVFALRSLLGR